VQPRVKLWLERDGRIVMSDYRLRLLQLVAETGSLADAAQRMDLSYRRAWGKVKELERNLGVPLVHSVPGGAGGGHSEITPEGLDLLRRYAEFHRRAAEAVQQAYDDAFGVQPAPSGHRGSG
jgi:molybdate transport system regulatory protein